LGVIGACGTGIDNIVVDRLRCQAKRGDRLRIAARNCGYETTISFNTRREDESNQIPCLRIQSEPAASRYSDLEGIAGLLALGALVERRRIQATRTPALAAARLSVDAPAIRQPQYRVIKKKINQKS
jgi:hypothetical protein